MRHAQNLPLHTSELILDCKLIHIRVVGSDCAHFCSLVSGLKLLFYDCKYVHIPTQCSILLCWKYWNLSANSIYHVKFTCSTVILIHLTPPWFNACLGAWCVFEICCTRHMFDQYCTSQPSSSPVFDHFQLQLQRSKRWERLSHVAMSCQIGRSRLMKGGA